MKQQQPQQNRLVNNMLAQSQRQQKALENQVSHLQAVIAVSFELLVFNRRLSMFNITTISFSVQSFFEYQVIFYYRPQNEVAGRYGFYSCLSVHGRGSAFPQCHGKVDLAPPPQHRYDPLDTVNRRAVRILLECILAYFIFNCVVT